MPSYAFIDESDTIIKVVEDGVEILYKKVYCTTDYSGDYFYFMAHELETGKMIQQYSLLYTDCTSPVSLSASALKTAVDLIIDSYATSGGGSGTVTTVSVTTANGVSGTVTNPTTTPAIELTLGAITPSSVASTGNVTGTNLSGTNTGDNATNTQYSGLAASKQDTLVSGTNIKTVRSQSLVGSGDVPIYSDMTVGAQGFNPADAGTVYFGQNIGTPSGVGTRRIYFRRSCTIVTCNINVYSAVAGTNEAWSIYIRLNNTTDTLVATVSAATNERIFLNTSLSIAIVSGDYIEFKMVNPTWVTNPTGTVIGGYITLQN